MALGALPPAAGFPRAFTPPRGSRTPAPVGAGGTQVRRLTSRVPSPWARGKRKREFPFLTPHEGQPPGGGRSRMGQSYKNPFLTLSDPAAPGLEVTRGRPATGLTRGTQSATCHTGALRRCAPGLPFERARRSRGGRHCGEAAVPASSARWPRGSAPASLRPAVPRSSTATPGAQAESWHLRESAPVSLLLCLVSEAPSSAVSLACGFALVR